MLTSLLQRSGDAGRSRLNYALTRHQMQPLRRHESSKHQTMNKSNHVHEIGCLSHRTAHPTTSQPKQLRRHTMVIRPVCDLSPMSAYTILHGKLLLSIFRGLHGRLSETRSATQVVPGPRRHHIIRSHQKELTGWLPVLTVARTMRTRSPS